MERVKATTDWMGRIKKGKTYKVIRRFFANGEGQVRIKDENGKVQVIPDVFFEEVE